MKGFCPTIGGPGFWRMQERLGPQRMEEMRLATTRAQAAALEEARRGVASVPESDRESYRGYPRRAP